MAKKQDIDFDKTEDSFSSSDDDFIPRKKQRKKLAKLVGQPVKKDKITTQMLHGILGFRADLPHVDRDSTMDQIVH